MRINLLRPRPAPKPSAPTVWRPELADLRRAELLLDQQFWLFGRDVILPPQNALVEYGLRRHPKPQGRQDGSCYANRTRKGTVLALWGFGAYFAAEHGVLVTRRSWTPLVSDVVLNPVGVWSPDELPVRAAQAVDAPFVLPLLARLCRWFAQYEEWILSVRPAGYDVRSLSGWPRIVIPRSDMAGEWRELALELESQIAQHVDDSLESVA